MNILRKAAQNCLNRLPPSITFLIRNRQAMARIRELEEQVQALRTAEVQLQERDWVNTTMINTLKNKLAEKEAGASRSSNGEDEIAALRKRVADLEDYIRLGCASRVAPDA